MSLHVGGGTRQTARTYPRPALGSAGATSANTTRATTTGDDYVDFCRFLQGLCGIDLLQYKRQQMERRLRSFYAQRGITDLREPFDRLKSDQAHLDELLDRITINVSQLWRNPEQWDLIEAHLIPELAARGRIDAWSAGCSYGAEAYTLATLFLRSGAGQSGSGRARPTFVGRIKGTDIDRRMVARARQGRFSHEDARTAPADKLRAGFNETPQGWQAKPEVKALTAFEIGDLLTGTPRANSFDLILCRNTVIYFNEPIRDELHARLAAALRPGGYLMVGSTERVANAAALNLSAARPFIYLKS